jgi:hypothetical protein
VGRFEPFLARHGRPSPATESSVFFAMQEHAELDWTMFESEVGVGVFAGGFLHVGTPELPAVLDALAEWTFVLKPDPKRQVVARNGYGDLAFVTHDVRGHCTAGVLSLRRARVERPDSRPDLASLLDFYLPDADRSRIPGRPTVHPFLDRDVWDAVVAARGAPLAMDAAVVPIVPEPLGGRQEVSNFRVEKLADYLREVAPIYARALAR